MSTEPHPAQPALDDNIRRTVERTALRKVRNLLDAEQEEQAAERRLRRVIFALCGVFAVLLLALVANLVWRT